MFLDTCCDLLWSCQSKIVTVVTSGEGYDSFEYISNLFLGSGGNIASMKSQRDSLRPEMQQNMSNSSIDGK